MAHPVIFLDIDGPMIPTRAFMFNFNASFDQILDDMCVKVLRHIIDKTDAQIVFNTTHNRMLEPFADRRPGLISQFVAAGFGDDIHPDNHTLYPDIDRTTAVREWLYRHPEVTHWVAFDDVAIDDERAYLTDPDHGIGWGEYQHARAYLLGAAAEVVLV